MTTSPSSAGSPEPSTATGPGTRRRLHSLRRLLPYIRPYRGLVALCLLGALLGTLAQLAVPLILARLIDGPIATGDKSGLIPLIALALAFGLAEAALFFLRRWTMTKSCLAMEYDLRGDMYRHLLGLPVSFHDRWSSGQLLSRTGSDVATIRRFVGFGAIFLVVNLVTCVVIVVILWTISWPLALFVTVAAGPLVHSGIVFERRYRSVSRQVQDQQGELATDVEESVLGIRIIKSLGRRRLVFDRYDAKAGKLQGMELAKVRLLAVIWSVFELQPQLVLAGLVVGGSLSVAAGTLTLGTLIGFIALFTVMVWPILSIGWLLAMTLESDTAAERIFELLDEAPTILDPMSPTEIDPAAVRGHLVLEGVGFRYPDAAQDILHRVDLDIRPGETVALVGATGSGKTTLTALIPRLYDVTAGRITLDGVDIRDLRAEVLRGCVSTAFEDATLFSMSARENLTLGRPDASEADVQEAIELAQADFLHDLPWGLATRLGEQGLSLSGGQRQRLALARAVLGRPPVLVLDDPLSALDVHTEALVEEALRRVLSATTALVVAHRASTVALADRVALLHEGTITHVGTHSQLMAEVPSYRDLLSSAADRPASMSGGDR